VKPEVKLYGDEIGRALEAFHIRVYYGRNGTQWGTRIASNNEGEAARLAARIAATLMQAGFTHEQVLLFSECLEFHPSGIFPTLRWPEFPDRPEVE
jgi:hypothetical protein